MFSPKAEDMWTLHNQFYTVRKVTDSNNLKLLSTIVFSLKTVLIPPIVSQKNRKSPKENFLALLNLLLSVGEKQCQEEVNSVVYFGMNGMRNAHHIFL